MRKSGYTGDGLLGYGENEVRVSRVWEDRGELVVQVVMLAWIRPHKTNYLILIPPHQIFDGLYNHFHVVKVTWSVEKNAAAQMGDCSKLVTKEKGIWLLCKYVHSAEW